MLLSGHNIKVGIIYWRSSYHKIRQDCVCISFGVNNIIVLFPSVVVLYPYFPFFWNFLSATFLIEIKCMLSVQWTWILYFIFKLDWMFIGLVLLPMILLPSLTPPPPPSDGRGGGYTSIMSLSSSLRLSQIRFYPLSWKIWCMYDWHVATDTPRHISKGASERCDFNQIGLTSYGQQFQQYEHNEQSITPHLKSPNTKRPRHISSGTKVSCVGQAQTCGGIKPVNCFHNNIIHLI